MIKTKNTQTHKHIAAIAAALAMTVLITLVMLVVGANALFNQNVTTTAQAAGLTSAATASDPAASDQALIDQLQAQISQYQARESQYQTELQNAADQINQLNQQDQQYKSLFSALQNAGVIQITSDGRVFIPNAFPPSFERERDDD